MNYAYLLVLEDYFFHAKYIAQRASLQDHLELVRIRRIVLLIHPERPHLTRLLDGHDEDDGEHGRGWRGCGGLGEGGEGE